MEHDSSDCSDPQTVPQSCQNCKYRKGLACHRHAPVLHPHDHSTPSWPKVYDSYSNNWCGEWELEP